MSKLLKRQRITLTAPLRWLAIIISKSNCIQDSNMIQEQFKMQSQKRRSSLQLYDGQLFPSLWAYSSAFNFWLSPGVTPLIVIKRCFLVSSLTAQPCSQLLQVKVNIHHKKQQSWFMQLSTRHCEKSIIHSSGNGKHMGWIIDSVQ